jgi:phage I-like protein
MKSPVQTPFKDLAVALAASMSLPDGDAAPEWVHLLPVTSGAIETFDGRGPYQIADAEAVIAASMEYERGIPIDENHATDLAAPKGQEAPARGWIKEMQARADGIWGRVEWTRAGAELVADKAYRGLSPVMILHADRKTVRLIPRASLVNSPNLRGLTALHQEQSMDLTKLAEALGLPATATLDEIIAAVGKLKEGGKPEAAVELESAMVEIGAALGVSGADRTAIVAAAKAKTAAQPAEITALQSEIATMASQLNTLTEGGKRSKAEAFVDSAITQGRVGVKPMRDRYITMHMADAANAEALITGLPVLGAGAQQLSTTPTQPGATLTTLNAEQALAADLLGIAATDYLATLNAERAKTEIRA